MTWPADTLAPAEPAQPASRAAGRATPAEDGWRLCQPALAFRALLAVQAAALLAVLWGAEGWPQALAALAPAIFAGMGGTLLWLLLGCGLRRPLARLAPPRRVAALTGLGAVAAAAAGGPLWAWGLVAASGPRLLALPLAGAALALPLALWIESRARGLRPADADARLAELQSRIRPHFLFNALNTALALVQVDPAKAEQVLEDLAELFRTAVAEQRSSVTLAEELTLAERYLAIEQVRFGPRLRVLWELDPAAARARVPPLLLQPLVENAVRHGIEPAADGGVLRVRTEARRGEVMISIDNTLAGRGAAPAAAGHGIALANVQERLRLMHDLAARFDARRLDGWWRVRITLPDEPLTRPEPLTAP
ncbi:histidine kinase [Aquincola tertiaricarbonis]|uniref:Histidine kinase n=1 Tax=Aquincola tertiaricarbonis TaxID=391953 RepID=A0ABY4S7K5_AQUTE|nr:histidine kinase [Aquincola tertiaricarbonis]URI07997.1 histidine kinase [Aquincola tertiaricarbonis]